MPTWLEWIVYILIVIVMLGVLVAVHEFGHLATAKMFKVYCFEYSVGMGPKIFSKKRKNGETYFSIRAVPFGGYVAMYGEPGAVPEGFEEPDPSRSLEAIKKWKKCLILVAGVTLNFVLGLVLIYIGDQFCPMYYSGYYGAVDATGTSLTTVVPARYGVETTSYIESHKPAESEWKTTDYVVSLPSYYTDLPNGQGETLVQILACDVSLYTDSSMTTKVNEYTYVACYEPATLIADHQIGDSIVLYPQAGGAAPQELATLGVTGIPVLFDAEGKSNRFNVSSLKDGVTINLPMNLVPRQASRELTPYSTNLLRLNDLKVSIKSGQFNTGEVQIQMIKIWNNFGEAWQRWAQDVPTAAGAVVRGFASLFTPDGWKNISGIIGITTAMPQITASGGARMVFFFAGMISINLAFFNLLPFPGLDGWALLMTGIEAVTHKKVPQKVAGIIQLVGFVLLIGLMILVAVKDIWAIFK